jgi:hypothetical protein
MINGEASSKFIKQVEKRTLFKSCAFLQDHCVFLFYNVWYRNTGIAEEEQENKGKMYSKENIKSVRDWIFDV